MPILLVFADGYDGRLLHDLLLQINNKTLNKVWLRIYLGVD